jgi:hypothetical protein
MQSIAKKGQTTELPRRYTAVGCFLTHVLLAPEWRSSSPFD